MFVLYSNHLVLVMVSWHLASVYDLSFTYAAVFAAYHGMAARCFLVLKKFVTES